MKILIIITKGNIGGATNFVFWLAEKLKEKGIEVKVGFGEGEYLKENLKKEKIDFINFHWLKRTKNPLANLLFIFEIKKFLEKEKFNVVHFNSTNALFGAIGAKISKSKPKTIFTFHGLSILDPNYKTPFKWFYFLIFKFLLKFIDIPVFVCQANLKWAKEKKLIKEGVVIYNGIETPEFLERELARRFFERKIKISLKDRFLIGSIGRLDYSKNYEFLIKIFPEILKVKPETILIIIGEGQERKKLERLIEKLNLKEKIFLIGEIKDASKYLRGFDLFVLPSRYEGLAITLIETLFAQIPVLASNVGGNEEIVGKECVFELNHKKEFLEKLKEPKIPKTPLEIFKIERMLGNYLKLYQSFNIASH